MAVTASSGEQHLRRALVDAVLGDRCRAEHAVGALRLCDEAAVLALATRCGVLGHLAVRAGDAWPAAQERSRWAHMRSVLLLHATAAAFRVFTDAEIEAVAIKGIGVIALLGAAAPERTTSDIDVVVRPRDAGAALRILREADFRDLDEPFERHVAQIASSVELHNFARTLRRGDVDIDLHWRFGPSPPYALDPSRLLARAVSSSIGADRIRVADPVDAILIAVHHALRLSFDITGTLRDLADLRRWWEQREVRERAEELVERAVCSELAPALIALCNVLVARDPSHDICSLADRLEARLERSERSEAARLLTYVEPALEGELPTRFTRAIFTPGLYLRSLVAELRTTAHSTARVQRPSLARRLVRLPTRIGRVVRELAHLRRLGGYCALARAQRRFH